MKQLSLFDNQARVEQLKKEQNNVNVTKKPKEYLTKQGKVAICYIEENRVVEYGKVKLYCCSLDGRTSRFKTKKLLLKYLDVK